MTYKKLPVVYSCSGCSNLAQMANQLAVNLNREKLAEMSCIAGVGGNVPALVKTAKSGRAILAIDGCHLACASNCLKQHGVKASKHLVLSELGYKKRYHQDVSDKDIAEGMLLVKNLCQEIIEQGCN
ncbi:MAG: putative zinc-binding protein [Kangiellaceae bacterium]|nr:putative zinc-binding protein [Kangiellaceae bacterium]